MKLSPKLFYGSQARSTAEALAGSSEYSLLCPSVDAESLGISEARQLLLEISEGLICDNIAVIVLGPLDSLSPKVSDAFLKTLEEPPPDLQIILWASDLGSVSKTLASRCHLQEALGAPIPAESLTALRSAINLDAMYLILEELKKLAGREREVLEYLLQSVSIVYRPKVWSEIRPLLCKPKVFRADVVSVILKLRGLL